MAGIDFEWWQKRAHADGRFFCIRCFHNLPLSEASGDEEVRYICKECRKKEQNQCPPHSS